MAGIGWLRSAVNLGRHNPAAIFGGAALMLAALFAVVLAMAALQLMLQPGMTGMMVLSVATMVVVLVLVSMLMAGYLRLIDAVEHGRPARARDVFGGFGDTTGSLRIIGFVLLLALLQNLLLVLMLSVFAGDVVTWYAQTMQSGLAGTQAAPQAAVLPDGIGIAAALMFVIILPMYAVQSIGLGQIALRGRGVFGALADGAAGAVKNVAPLLLFALACVIAVVVLSLGLMLVALLVGVLAKLAGAWLAFALGIPLYIGLLLAIYVVMFGVMYHLWRDVCGDGDVVELPAGALTA